MTHDIARKGIGAQIARQRQRAAAARLDLVHDRADPGRVDIGDADRRALFGKTQRAGAPHARGRRRDNPDLPS
jgi:hypothetical protein